MPWVGFESTISVFVRAKTIHALDRAATVIRGNQSSSVRKNRTTNVHEQIAYPVSKIWYCTLAILRIRNATHVTLQLEITWGAMNK
jgi:hypothetical protein